MNVLNEKCRLINYWTTEPVARFWKTKWSNEIKLFSVMYIHFRLNLLLSCKLKYDCMKCYTLDNFENIDSCLSIYYIHVNE